MSGRIVFNPMGDRIMPRLRDRAGDGIATRRRRQCANRVPSQRIVHEERALEDIAKDLSIVIARGINTARQQRFRIDEVYVCRKQVLNR